MDGSYQSLEALPIEHLQIVFVASSSCSDDDAPAAAAAAAATTTAGAPVCPQRPTSKKSLPNGSTDPASPKAPEPMTKTKSRKSPSKRVTGKDRGRARSAGAEKKAGGGGGGGEEEEVLDAPPDGFPLRRVISIEEDHLAHLLHGGPQPLLHQLSEEEDEVHEGREARSDMGTGAASAAAAAVQRSSPLAVQVSPPKRTSPFKLASRGQPVGKESQQVRPELPAPPSGTTG